MPSSSSSAPSIKRPDGWLKSRNGGGAEGVVGGPGVAPPDDNVDAGVGVGVGVEATGDPAGVPV